MTRQRRIVLETLQALRVHPTAEELHGRVRRRLPNIGLATVYRNLELLAARGLIRRLELGCGCRRFDADLAPHYHVRCTRCGRMDDVAGSPPSRLEKIFRSPKGFRITGHQLVLTGVCARCRPREEKCS
jgi:Fur family ferric uptake transcriptional regulator